MHNDETGYDEHYKDVSITFGTNPEDYMAEFEERFTQTFANGGWIFDGGQVKRLLEELEKHNVRKVLDAGSGLGEVSVYLACKGYEVTGVEISEEGVSASRQLAERIGVDCKFVKASLSDTGLADGSFDAVVGKHTLHHFIKYDGVAEELRRVSRPGAVGLFLDPYSENLFKNFFHNKNKLAQLGDELLTERKITEFFFAGTCFSQPVELVRPVR